MELQSEGRKANNGNGCKDCEELDNVEAGGLVWRSSTGFQRIAFARRSSTPAGGALLHAVSDMKLDGAPERCTAGRSDWRGIGGKA